MSVFFTVRNHAKTPFNRGVLTRPTESSPSRNNIRRSCEDEGGDRYEAEDDSYNDDDTDILARDMNTDRLAKFMFLDNVGNTKISLNVNGIENSKGLFVFFVNLLCKGLLFMYGTGVQGASSSSRMKSVDVMKLSQEQFDAVRQKMRLAGIDVRVVTLPNTDDDMPFCDLHGLILTMRDDAPLTEYMFRVVTRQNVYLVSFDLIRMVDRHEQCHRVA